MIITTSTTKTKHTAGKHQTNTHTTTTTTTTTTTPHWISCQNKIYKFCTTKQTNTNKINIKNHN